MRPLLLAVLVVSGCDVAVSADEDGGAATGGGSAAAGGGSATGGGSAATGGGSAATGGGSAATGGGTGSDDGGVDAGLSNFSFFVTSYAAMQVLSGSVNGFGGDLRYGETGPGAGLRGADKICAAIAERTMPGSSVKGWRAFLSAHAGEDGGVVHARDRIGPGPWYDRNGRLVATSRANLLNTRPMGCDALICNDLPNEDGVPNHAPDGQQVDNHDTLTGSNAQGMLQTSRPNTTCQSWTTAATDAGQPQLGHSWPAQSGQSWTTVHFAGGCGAGVNLAQTGGPNAPTVGAGGGYGGIYCFALTP